jgi:alkylation response protein AidB-like acyl-CoA dehydrogenase
MDSCRATITTSSWHISWTATAWAIEAQMAEHPLVQQARSLAAEFAPRSLEIEANRKLPADIVERMGAAGFYRLFIVERLGGLEVPPSVAAQVFEALAEADAACGWIAFIGATTGLALARMTDAAVREVFAAPETLIAGVFAPSGKAVKVDGGFCVNGRWQWGSGSPNADWIGGGCVLIEGDKPLTNSAGMPRNHMLLFRAADVHLLDTWHASGLRGTGSTDFAVRDLFVPEAHASGYLVKDLPDRPLFHFPQFSLLAHGVAAVSMGIARASIREFVRIAVEKKRYGTSVTLSNRAHSHIEVAAAEARLRSARAFFYETIETAWSLALNRVPATLEVRRDMRLATTHAVQSSVQVVDAMYTLAGGSAVYESSPLQRQLRDVHVASQHITVSSNTLETIGQLLLGVEANTATL